MEEQATHAGNDTELSEMEKQVIAIAQSYSEKNLMQVYSRQQTVAGFLSSVTAEMLKKQLRPFIDKKIREMVRLMQANHLPVYMKEPGVKLLYEHDRMRFSGNIAEISFRFEITDHFFSVIQPSVVWMEKRFLYRKKKVYGFVFKTGYPLVG